MAKDTTLNTIESIPYEDPRFIPTDEELRAALLAYLAAREAVDSEHLFNSLR